MTNAALAWPQPANPESNLHFIEQIIRTFADSLFVNPVFDLCDKLTIQVSARTNQEDAALFLQDVLLMAAADRGKAVILKPDKRHEPITNQDQQKLNLRLVIEDWQLAVNRNQNNAYKQKFEQNFRSQIRYVATNARDSVLLAEKKWITGSRKILNEKTLTRVQSNQPEFASVSYLPKPGKNDLLQSLLITITSAVTVFLIYHYRSQ